MSEKAQFGKTFEAEVAKARAMVGERAEKPAEAKRSPEAPRPVEESAEQTPTEKLWAGVADEKQFIGAQKKGAENSIRLAQTRGISIEAGTDLVAASEKHAAEIEADVKKFEGVLVGLNFRVKVLDKGLQDVAEGKAPDAAFRDQLNEIKKRLVQEAVFAQQAYQDVSEKYKNSSLGMEDPVVKDSLKFFEAKKKKVQDFLSGVEGSGIRLE